MALRGCGPRLGGKGGAPRGVREGRARRPMGVATHPLSRPLGPGPERGSLAGQTPLADARFGRSSHARRGPRGCPALDAAGVGDITGHAAGGAGRAVRGAGAGHRSAFGGGQCAGVRCGGHVERTADAHQLLSGVPRGGRRGRGAVCHSLRHHHQPGLLH